MDLPLGFLPRDVARIAAAVRAYESGELDRRPEPTIRQPDRNFARVSFRNDNAGTVPTYGVMRVTGVVTVDGQPYFKIDKPDTSFNRLYLVNGDEPIATGQYGCATWLWHGGYVLYDTGNTPAVGEEWGPQNGTWTIKKYRYGFSIFAGNVGTGATSATIAVQAPVNLIYGQTQGTIAFDATNGIVEPYDGNNTIIDASTTITVANRMGPATALADNIKVTCKWCGGTWITDAAKIC